MKSATALRKFRGAVLVAGRWGRIRPQANFLDGKGVPGNIVVFVGYSFT